MSMEARPIMTLRLIEESFRFTLFSLSTILQMFSNRSRGDVSPDMGSIISGTVQSARFPHILRESPRCARPYHECSQVARHGALW